MVSHPPHPSHEAQKPWEGLSPPGHRDLTVALGTTRDGTPQGLERQCHTVSLQNIIDMKYSWDTLNILSGFVLASLPGVQGRGWDSKLRLRPGWAAAAHTARCGRWSLEAWSVQNAGANGSCACGLIRITVQLSTPHSQRGN